MKVVFKTKGELSPLAYSVFGISVKENENPIGYFGTGLKYAIAVLLRNGGKIKIYNTDNSIVDFSPTSTVFRETDVQVIKMTTTKGSEVSATILPYTLELGKKWELWEAYRELACNTIDESGEIFACQKLDGLVTPGFTQIEIICPKFFEIYQNRRQYILEICQNFLVEDSDKVQVVAIKTSSLYYRNVRVVDLPKPTIMTYNLITPLELTEDRTVLHSWRADRIILASVVESENSNYIETFLTAPQGSYEADLQFEPELFTPSCISGKFIEITERLHRDCVPTLNLSALQVLSIIKPTTIYLPVKLTSTQVKTADKVLEFLFTAGFNVEKYPIIYVASLGVGTHGLAKDNTIYISTACFLQGSKYLASTLYEEFVHLETGYKDCSRGLQTYLFDTIITQFETILGESL